jgi:hypothetical protein
MLSDKLGKESAETFSSYIDDKIKQDIGDKTTLERMFHRYTPSIKPWHLAKRAKLNIS